MDKIILIGAGGHARSVVDTIEKQGHFEIAGFVDAEEIGQKVYRSYTCLGQDEDLIFYTSLAFIMRLSVWGLWASHLREIGFMPS